MKHALQRLVARLKGEPPGSIKKSVKPRRLPDAQYAALDALKCRVWYNEYGGYCLPESSLHRTAPRKILRASVYEPDTIAFMRERCGGGDVVHAGTYFGDFLPGVASALDPGCTLWAFEPNRENFRCASITALINDLDNVKLTNAGLGARAETLWFRTRAADGSELGGKSHVVPEAEADAGTDDRVDIVTIDESVDAQRPVSIIQLDVEDHEQAALTGAMETIRRCRPIIILEVRKDSNLLESEWFKNTILALGYAQSAHLHGNQVFEPLS